MDELNQLLRNAESRVKYIEPDQVCDLNELPTKELKDLLLFKIEQSQISEETEKYIRMNLYSMKLTEFWALFNRVIDQTYPIDPRKQWKQFIFSQSNPTFF